MFMKKTVYITILTLILTLCFVSSVFAGSAGKTGTYPYTFTTSDGIPFSCSYDYVTSDTGIYSIAAKKNAWDKHINDGTINNVTETDPHFSQDMTNNTRFYSRTSSTANYTEVGIINFWEWKDRSVIIPSFDSYFPGYNNDKLFHTTVSNGKVVWYWWVYISEGDWGATKSVERSLYQLI